MKENAVQTTPTRGTNYEMVPVSSDEVNNIQACLVYSDNSTKMKHHETKKNGYSWLQIFKHMVVVNENEATMTIVTNLFFKIQNSSQNV